MPAPADVQAATLQRFLDAWERWSAEEQLALFSDDFTQATLPLRLGIPPRPRAQVEQVLPKLVELVKSYQLTFHEIVHDVEKNKAAVYAVSKGKLPWGPWDLEYSVFITFSNVGDKVARLEEMMDPAFLQDFGPKFRQYMEYQTKPASVAAEIPATEKIAAERAMVERAAAEGAATIAVENTL